MSVRTHTCVGTHPGFETQNRHHQKSQNRDISGPTERTRCPPKFKKIVTCFVKHEHMVVDISS